MAGKTGREAPRRLEPVRRVTVLIPHDVWIYRIAVTTLGLAVCGTLVGGIVLATLGKTVPETVVALGSAAVGALAGLLTRVKPDVR